MGEKMDFSGILEPRKEMEFRNEQHQQHGAGMQTPVVSVKVEGSRKGSRMGKGPRDSLQQTSQI